jgi:protein SCO1/2
MRFLSRLLRVLATALTLSLLFTAAPRAETDIHPVRGFLPDLHFKLQGAERSYTEEDFTGKTVIVFFGYASCPDICPTTMAQLSQVMNQLGPDASHVRILFISVDPHRDTPQALQTYVNAFDSHAIGLTGTQTQVADLARRYRVAFQIEKPDPASPNNYQVAHSRGIYIFDAHGRARLLASDGESINALTAAVRKIIAEK